ncbi:MAG: hypothetical protein RLZZ210_124 [Pseudomonadota bacterium]|jgi:hypothetical protein
MAKVSFFKSMFTSSSSKQLELDNAKQSSLARLTDSIAHSNCSNIYAGNPETMENMQSILRSIENSYSGSKVLKQVAYSIKHNDKHNKPDINISNTSYSHYITSYFAKNSHALKHTKLNALLNKHKGLCKAMTINPQLSFYLKSLTADKSNQNLDRNQILTTLSQAVNEFDQKEISSRKNKATFYGSVIGGTIGATVGATAGLAVGATIDFGLFGMGMGIPTASSAVLGIIGGGLFGTLAGGISARKYAGAKAYANLIEQYQQPFYSPPSPPNFVNGYNYNGYGYNPATTLYPPPHNNTIMPMMTSPIHQSQPLTPTQLHLPPPMLPAQSHNGAELNTNRGNIGFGTNSHVHDYHSNLQTPVNDGIGIDNSLNNHYQQMMQSGAFRGNDSINGFTGLYNPIPNLNGENGYAPPSSQIPINTGRVQSPPLGKTPVQEMLEKNSKTPIFRPIPRPYRPENPVAKTLIREETPSPIQPEHADIINANALQSWDLFDAEQRRKEKPKQQEFGEFQSNIGYGQVSHGNAGLRKQNTTPNPIPTPSILGNSFASPTMGALSKGGEIQLPPSPDIYYQSLAKPNANGIIPTGEERKYFEA